MDYYKVVVSEVYSEEKLSEPGDIYETFLTYEEAFSYVGWCMGNDIEEFGRPDVYQIWQIDSSGRVICVTELDNDVIEPPCHKPTYSAFGCLGCTRCKKEKVSEADVSVLDEKLDFIISEDDLPF